MNFKRNLSRIVTAIAALLEKPVTRSSGSSGVGRAIAFGFVAGLIVAKSVRRKPNMDKTEKTDKSGWLGDRIWIWPGEEGGIYELSARSCQLTA